MKMSTKGRYGLRALVDLAAHSNREHVSLFNIAQRQQISENYLESVFSQLKKSGIVKSVKGAGGGYMLAQEPSDIRIGTILRVLEGNLSIIDVDIEVDRRDSISYCIKQNVWDKVNDKINDLVDSMTLEDMITEYNRINGLNTIMYYI